jgi:uncharacterized phosphatase
MAMGSTEAITTLVLVRHGETDWNAEGRLQGQRDIPLNATGLQQAAWCAARLAKDPDRWQVVVSSPLARARDTAAIIAKHLRLPQPQLLPALKERNYGQGEGRTWEEIRAFFPTGVPDAESSADLGERMLRALERVRETHAGRRVVVVSHGGAINAALAALSAGEIGTGRTRIANGSLTRIHHDGARGWVVDTYNEPVEPLEPEAETFASR